MSWELMSSGNKERLSVKRCCTSYVIRDVQTKPAMRSCCTPIGTAEGQRTDAARAGQGAGPREVSLGTRGKAERRSHVGRQWRVPAKPNVLCPCDPAVELLGVYPKELKTRVHTKSCTWLFIEASLFIIVKTWKRPKHLSAGEWANKLVYPQNKLGVFF